MQAASFTKVSSQMLWEMIGDGWPHFADAEVVAQFTSDSRHGSLAIMSSSTVDQLHWSHVTVRHITQASNFQSVAGVRRARASPRPRRDPFKGCFPYCSASIRSDLDTARVIGVGRARRWSLSIPLGDRLPSLRSEGRTRFSREPAIRSKEKCAGMRQAYCIRTSIPSSAKAV